MSLESWRASGWLSAHQPTRGDCTTAGGRRPRPRVLQTLSMTIALPPGQVGRLDAFRKKRNLSEYERIGTVSDREVGEIVESAATVRSQVEAWIRTTHPELL